VTRVVPDSKALATATETAQQLAAKPADALRTCKRLLKRSARGAIKEAIRVENETFAALL
jgi:enoyl-CoA hydratase/carnithine racemase